MNLGLSRPELIIVLVAMSLYLVASVCYTIVRSIREERARRRQWDDAHIVMRHDDPSQTSLDASIPVIYYTDNHKEMKKILTESDNDDSLIAIPGTMKTEADVERALLDKGYSLKDIQDENMDGNIVVIHNREFGYHLFIDKSIIKRGHADE